MSKDTKICQLTVFMSNGARIAGKLHVPMSTSSAVRPSDAVRTIEGGFIVLSDVTIQDKDGTREQGAIMIRMDAIAHIELPEQNWSTRTNAERPSTAGISVYGD